MHVTPATFPARESHFVHFFQNVTISPGRFPRSPTARGHCLWLNPAMKGKLLLGHEFWMPGCAMRAENNLEYLFSLLFFRGFNSIYVLLCDKMKLDMLKCLTFSVKFYFRLSYLTNIYYTCTPIVFSLASVKYF